MASGEEGGLDGLVPPWRPDDDLEEVVESFHAAVLGTGGQHWIRGCSLRAALRCCCYLRHRLLVARDKFVITRGRCPAIGPATPTTRAAGYPDRTSRQSSAPSTARSSTLVAGLPPPPSKLRPAGCSSGVPPPPVPNSEPPSPRLRADPSLRSTAEQPDFPTERPARPQPLGPLLRELKAERDLAGDQLPGMSSTAEELQREKRRLKLLLRGYSEKVGAAPMELERVRPAFVMYHTLTGRLRELDGGGAGAELRKEAERAGRRLQALCMEATELQARLRQYEEAFVAHKGRRMQCKAEIAPVASDYERFQQVKALIAELANKSAE